MRIASFNVENMFLRAKALNLSTWAEGRPALERYAKVNALLNQVTYSPQDKVEIARLLTELELDRSDQGSGFVRLRQNRGSLLKRANGVIDVVARGRADWGGWVELKLEAVNEASSQHIARMIEEVDPDILGVVEVENRPALREFNTVLEAIGADPYAQVMVIDGNDDRGIDVGIAAKLPWQITEIRSHVDDRDAKGTVFSRDCPEYVLETESGKRIVVLVNHLKSKGYAAVGETPDARRERQARRVATIYRRLRNAGENYIAILGDLNDFKAAARLRPFSAEPGSRTSLTTLRSRWRSRGNLRPARTEGQVRLRPSLTRSLRPRRERRRLPARRVGQEPEPTHEVADLRHAHKARGCCFRSCSDLRRRRSVSAQDD